MEMLDFIKSTWFLVAAIVSVTLWLGRMEFIVKDNKETIHRHIDHISTLLEFMNEAEITIANNIKEIDRLRNGK